MAYIKLRYDENKYSNPNDLEKLIYYIFYPAKNPRGLYGQNLIISQCPPSSPDSVISQFLTVQDTFPKPFKRRIYHIIYSLDSAIDVNTLPVIYSIGLCFLWLYSNYQSVFSVHEDTDNLHLHLVINNIPIAYEYETLSHHINLINFETIADIVQNLYRDYYETHRTCNKLNPNQIARDAFEVYRKSHIMQI